MLKLVEKLSIALSLTNPLVGYNKDNICKSLLGQSLTYVCRETSSN